jgi:hypothetical protein
MKSKTKPAPVAVAVIAPARKKLIAAVWACVTKEGQFAEKAGQQKTAAREAAETAMQAGIVRAEYVGEAKRLAGVPADMAEATARKEFPNFGRMVSAWANAGESLGLTKKREPRAGKAAPDAAGEADTDTDAGADKADPTTPTAGKATAAQIVAAWVALASAEEIAATITAHALANKVGKIAALLAGEPATTRTPRAGKAAQAPAKGKGTGKRK